MIELYVLLGLMIAGAVIAVEVKDLLSAVIAVGVVGLALSIAFLLLRAPDVAITQIVVEIAAVILLIRATLNRDISSRPSAGRPFGAVMGLAFLGLGVLASLTAFPEGLSPFGSPLMTVSAFYPADAMSGTGATNVVSAVILDYRGYDTLGEATVLFTAVVGVLAVMRATGRRDAEGSGESHG